MVRTKEEILADIASKADVLGDSVVTLLADITDSMGTQPDLSQYVPKADHEKLRNEFVNRFMGGTPSVPMPETDEKPPIEGEDETYESLLGIKVES